ncbi:MAG: hypothetical protein LH630_03380, partial [Actinomycetia bacterium]|nr:hypothetical protein [Actinomycetes bacterium]
MDAQDLLLSRLVESWGACETPGGFVVVHHDGWTSAEQAVGMRRFSGTGVGVMNQVQLALVTDPPARLGELPVDKDALPLLGVQLITGGHVADPTEEGS